MHHSLSSPQCGTAFLLFAILASQLGAQTTTVNMISVADNTLYESPTGALSNGSGTGVFIGLTGTGGIRRGVFRFDVAAAVPANAQILAATITLNVAQSTAFLPVNATGHRLLASWGEGASVAIGGGGGGAPSATNDATWKHRFFPTQNWAAAGGDFDPTPSFVIAMPNFGLCTSLATIQAAADAQAWLTNPAQNFGWLLKTDETLAATAHRMDSRESIAGPRPTLTVTYLLPGQNGTWGTGCPIGAGTFQTAWVGAPIGGTTVQIAKTNGQPSSVGVDFFTFTLDPLGTTLFPGCTIYLPLAGFFSGGTFFTNGAGSGTSPFNVPVGFSGYPIITQAVVLDFSPLGFALSNAAITVLQ